MPWLAVKLLLVAAGAWVLAVTYALTLHPEVAFYRAALLKKQAWVRTLEARTEHKVVVAGGSSAAFAIDGELLEEEFHLPTVNLGLHAAFGAPFLCQAALRACRPGDTLVLALEPFLLTDPTAMAPTAYQVAYRTGQPELLRWADEAESKPWPRISEIVQLRPEGTQNLVLLGKALLGKPGYRYRADEVSRSGYQTTTVRIPVGDAPAFGPQLAPAGRALLGELVARCARRQVRLCYTIPWSFSPPAEADANRLRTLRFLREVEPILPILKDETQGVLTDATAFADTLYHLTAEVARHRTRHLGERLAAWRVWTSPELAQAEARLKGK